MLGHRAMSASNAATSWDISNGVFDGYTASFIMPAEGLFLNSDGTKAYTINFSSDLTEYNLSTGWNLDTGSFVQVVSISAQLSTGGENLFFKPDGTKMYAVSTSFNDVFEYNLATAWNISSLSYVQAYRFQSGQSIFARDVFFKPDGTKMYVLLSDAVREYNLSTAWNVSTASFVQTFTYTPTPSFSDFFFRDDGTKMYARDTGNLIREYNLSTAWNISTSSSVQSLDLSAEVAGAGGAEGMFFKPDGTKIYFGARGIVSASSNNVKEFSLSTAWNISTASSSRVGCFSVVDQNDSIGGLAFSSDGTKMYTSSKEGASTRNMHEYTLSAAWDVTTASFVRTSSLGTMGSQAPQNIYFRDDGTKLYVVDPTNLQPRVFEYNLSTAWNISSLSFVRTFSVFSQESTPQSVFFKPDGTKMYVMGTTGDDVNEYNLSTAWDISTASFVQVFSVSTQDTLPASLFFKPDGTKMYVLGDTNDDVYEYNLSTAWNVSTASFVQSLDIGSKESVPIAISFKSDGTRMYVVGEGKGIVLPYDL